MTDSQNKADVITVGFPIEVVEISVLQTTKGTKGYFTLHRKSALSLISELTRVLQESEQEKTDE